MIEQLIPELGIGGFVAYLLYRIITNHLHQIMDNQDMQHEELHQQSQCLKRIETKIELYLAQDRELKTVLIETLKKLVK